MNEKGKTVCIAITAYTAAKQLLNLIIGGFSLNGLLSVVIIAVIMGLALLSGIKYMNYVVSAVIAFVILRHIGYNISNFPSTIIYLLEAAIDVVCIILLTLSQDVKANFTKWIN
ncbi:MAG: hypothetical protein IJ666_07105 [Ruminococcus sp.]|nr:hypothetical protein [Ruminococcus sp.]